MFFAFDQSAFCDLPFCFIRGHVVIVSGSSIVYIQMLISLPEFTTAVQALLASKEQALSSSAAAAGEHLCFIGSGREEEDQYVHMVVAHFLQRHLAFVSVVAGGYAGTYLTVVICTSSNGFLQGFDTVGFVTRQASDRRLACKEILHQQLPKGSSLGT